MPHMSMTQELYDRIKPRTNNKKPYQKGKVSFSDVVEKALNDQEAYNKIMENVK